MEQFGYFEDFLEMFGSLWQHKDRIFQFTVSEDIHKSAAIGTLATTFLIRKGNAYLFTKYPLFDGMGDAYFKSYA